MTRDFDEGGTSVETAGLEIRAVIPAVIVPARGVLAVPSQFPMADAVALQVNVGWRVLSGGCRKTEDDASEAQKAEQRSPQDPSS